MEQSLAQLAQSRSEVLNGIHASLGQTAQQVVSSEQAATQAVGIARDLVQRMEHLRDFWSVPKAWWKRTVNVFRSKR